MNIENYLKNYQPTIYQTLFNSLKNGRVAHAYLLTGEHGTPILEIAKFIAKSLVCKNSSPFACDKCIECIKIDEESSQNFILIDGEKATIKKDDIISIKSSFEETSLEKNAKFIYILHHVENATSEAINALLKFLEEPTLETYAILTSQNEQRVLPTILSRSEILRIKLRDRREIIDESVALGVDEAKAQVFSFFINDPEKLLESVDDPKLNSLMQVFEHFLDAMTLGRDYLLFETMSKFSNELKDKTVLRMFLDILGDFFANLIIYKKTNIKLFTNYVTIMDSLLCKLNEAQLDSVLVEIFKKRQVVDLNVNTNLILEDLAIKIFRGE